MDRFDASIIAALRNSPKALIKYDRYFEEEGRTKEIIEEISSQLTQISISPKSLSLIKVQTSPFPVNAEAEKHSLTSPTSSATESKKDEQVDPVSFFPDVLNMKELLIVEYEDEQVQHGQELYNKKRAEYEKFSLDLQQQIVLKYNMRKHSNQLSALRNIELFQRSQEHLLKNLYENQKHIQRNEEQELNRKLQEIESQRLEDERNQAEEHMRSALQEHKNCIFSGIMKKVEDAFKSCDPALLSTPKNVWMKYLNDLAANVDDLLISSRISEETIQKFQASFRNLERIYISIISEVVHAQKKALDEMHNKDTSVGKVLRQASETPLAVTEEPKTTDTVHAQKKALDELEDTSVGKVLRQAGETCLAIAETEKTDTAQAQNKASDVLHSEEISTGKVSRQSSETYLPIVEKQEIDTGSTQPVKSNFMKHDVSLKEEECDTNIEEMEENTSESVSEKQPSKRSNIGTETATEYWTAVENLKTFEASLESFKTNPELKKYRMLLHKAVAINNIGDASSRQLKSKIVHLTNLLSEQTVDCGGKYTSCRQHPAAVNYCKNLLAEKIVTQGEEQVQSKIDFAFPFAFVAVALCSKFPDLWQLLLGHFYSRCPYLAPYYLKRNEVQSDEEYMKCIGFKYIDGKIEEITIYLKRMYGYTVLYAAILQTTLPPGFAATRVNNIARGWMWLSYTLNMDPKPDVTATMILGFLEVLGHTLEKTYDRQFKKMLHVLCKDYFPKIKGLTSATAGPIGRLKVFLQSAITKGHIPLPSGASNNYYRSF